MSFGLARGKQLETAGYGLVMSDLPGFEVGDVEGCRVDPREWFGERDGDSGGGGFEIEIGSGKGTFLVQQGAIQPEVNFLGIEWAGEFFRYAADRMRRRGLENVRVLHGDATEFLRYRCAEGIASVIHLYFSDPWPKKRHHKRRVVQDRSLEDFHRILGEGGELRLVTDHAELWGWYEAHMGRCGELFERREFLIPASAGEGELVGTNYERKFVKEGRPFFSATLIKK